MDAYAARVIQLRNRPRQPGIRLANG